MIISIHQPAYLPWLGYFDKIIRSDIHVVLDHVQFEKNSFINRNRIGTKQGPKWLTIPVSTSGKFGQLPINEVKTCNHLKWHKKHFNSLMANYAKTKYFNNHLPFLQQLYQTEHELLVNVTQAMLQYFIHALQIETKIVLSSEMNVQGSKDELVLNICKALNANCYLSGALGIQYLNIDSFKQSGIEVIFQDYKHPTYEQTHGAFTPNLSIIDLLMHEGPQSSDILRSSALAS